MQKTEISRIPVDLLEELAALSQPALREPWTVAEGDDIGQGWPVASFGQDEVDPQISIWLETDGVHASEIHGTARDEARWCARARKLLGELGQHLFKDDRRTP